jgi:hypothetical protein
VPLKLRGEIPLVSLLGLRVPIRHTSAAKAGSGSFFAFVALLSRSIFLAMGLIVGDL